MIIKEIFILLIFFSLADSNIFSQDLAPFSDQNSFIGNFKVTDNNPFDSDNSVITVLNDDGTHSRHSAPQSLFRYARCYFLILASEMQASGFPSNVNITSLGYNYKYGTDLAAKGFLKVYFQNTSDITNNKSLNWNSAVQGMSLVHADTLQFQTPPGIFDIHLDSSENFIYTGGGIYVAFEYSNPGGPLAVVSNVVWANVIQPNPILKSSQSDDSLRVIATGTSNLRPETRFGCSLSDIVRTGPVYSMGMTGISLGSDSNFIKTVINHVRSEEDTILVTTSVKRISDGFVKHLFIDTVQSENIESIIITNKYLLESETGSDSILVNAFCSNEEITGNNNSFYINKITPHSWNHYITSMPPAGGVGLSVGTGDYVARFHTPSEIKICAADLSFFALTGFGYSPYKVIFYAADGPGGLPGTLLHKSPLRISPAGSTGNIKRSTYILDSALTIGEGYYYAGYSQTDARNLRVSYQTEDPIRTGEFFYKQPAGGGSWIEFGDISPYRFDIAPRTFLSLSLNLFLEGFYNGDEMIPDTIKIIVRNQTIPYSSVDSSQAVIDSAGHGLFNFINVNLDSCYYFDVRHRNHIRTFSHSTCENFNSAISVYDFTTTIDKAFGNNMKFITGINTSGSFAIYGGDVNQDGLVDLADVSMIDNDVINFETGYLSTDANGDSLVDLADLLMADNNGFNFVTKITP
ncbi:MAG TPA: hypothetical protein PLX80_08740 [Ignavibacteria bacterium]|nr:hypothetical protein [Ignavibacteria bacterium]